MVLTKMIHFSLVLISKKQSSLNKKFYVIQKIGTPCKIINLEAKF